VLFDKKYHYIVFVLSTPAPYSATGAMLLAAYGKHGDEPLNKQKKV
jgi:hypothetical protein